MTEIEKLQKLLQEVRQIAEQAVGLDDDNCRDGLREIISLIPATRCKKRGGR